ncbi:hypothetical protein ABTX15_31215 [Micromonospora sp. NPDC094482]|uniref:hypothetical protein n=1 Tax=unclassified Micromonospora TaxID=2617518 RepID=UPI0033336A2F
MPTPDYLPARGSTAVFSGPWLRYAPIHGAHRYYEGYVATVLGWWNGVCELSIDAETASALAKTFTAMADYVGGDWRTVDFDGHVLTVARPPSLGGGVHRVEPANGRYRIGWGLPWLSVNPQNCDHVFGTSSKVGRVRRAPAADADAGWGPVLAALHAAGATDGRDAAARWAQHALDARRGSDATKTARQVLAEASDIDAPILDGLPTADRYRLIEDSDRYAEHAPPGAPAWKQLTARQCDQARWTWCDGYDDAAHAEAARRCRMFLHPDGDDRDLSHVHPDQVRLGGPGVFAGDWAWTPNPNGELRIPVGFAGTLVDTWNGWAVFTCTREVAEAIVADQQEARDRYRQHLTRAVSPASAWSRRSTSPWHGCGSTAPRSSSTRHGCTATPTPSNGSPLTRTAGTP